MRRGSLSRPMARALDDGLLAPGTTLFDYGCGRGDDLRRLAALGFEVAGWDPAYRPDAERHPADIVNFGYVANVIEDPVERAETLKGAWELARSALVVAARLDWEARGIAAKRFGDGLLTANGTFQKFFTQHELQTWIDTVLGTRSIAAAPGVFYVFRDEGRAQSFLASRVRRRLPRTLQPQLTATLYEANRDILQPLEEFVLTRGRAPEPEELPGSDAIRERFGSINRALNLVRQVTGDDAWEAAHRSAEEDLLVYLALAAFGGRPKFSALPFDLQLDVKAFFSSYKEACRVADEALFSAGRQDAIDQACRASSVGKLTPEALYVHVSALDRLIPLLRIYEGCGRALTGMVPGTTIVKLNRLEPKVTYLAYPDFDRDPHPVLSTSVRSDLRKLDVKFSDFRASANPPILHRKETFVGPDYPRREMFAHLTRQEEKAGLLDNRLTIGTRSGWQAELDSRSVRLRGHRLVRVKTASG